MREELEQTIGVYDRTAGEYASRWAAHVSPALAELAARADGIVLDAGCGPGRDLGALTALGIPAIGLDLSTGMVATARAAGLSAVVADVCALPFPAGTFGGIWASASLVHLDAGEAGAALAELHRVATPGGPAYVTVKARGSGEGAIQDVSGFDGGGDDARWFRFWDADEFAQLAVSAGWRLDTVTLAPDSTRPTVHWVALSLQA